MSYSLLKSSWGTYQVILLLIRMGELDRCVHCHSWMVRIHQSCSSRGPGPIHEGSRSYCPVLDDLSPDPILILLVWTHALTWWITRCSSACSIPVDSWVLTPSTSVDPLVATLSCGGLLSRLGSLGEHRCFFWGVPHLFCTVRSKYLLPGSQLRKQPGLALGWLWGQVGWEGAWCQQCTMRWVDRERCFGLVMCFPFFS